MPTTKTESTFRLEYAVAVAISASPETIWRRLTSAKEFPAWNSTVTSIEGEIAKGNALVIRVPSTERVLKASVLEFEPNQKMVWGAGFAPMFKGQRTFTLSPNADGTTQFAMNEVFAGMMLPMIKGSLPDFGPVFDQYVVDLKQACEKV